jgi:hypothetical protein
MAVSKIYSKRKAVRERSENDIYVYDDIPNPLRSQLKRMYDEAYQNYTGSVSRRSSFQINFDELKSIVSILRRE